MEGRELDVVPNRTSSSISVLRMISVVGWFLLVFLTILHQLEIKIIIIKIKGLAQIQHD